MASRAELTCTSYTVSNEERSLSPVGGAITADYWVDPYAPRYFWYACCNAYTLHLLYIGSSRGLGQHGRVFTHGPSPWNPYTIQFSRYCLDILF